MASIGAGQLEVSFVPVPHVVGMSSFAILFSFGKDKSAPTLRWSGDTTFFPEAVYQNLSAERDDKVFHDCTFFPHYPATVHTHFEELQTLSLEARRHTCLIHHGKLTGEREFRDEMEMGQPLQKFTWNF